MVVVEQERAHGDPGGRGKETEMKTGGGGDKAGVWGVKRERKEVGETEPEQHGTGMCRPNY